MKFNLDDAPWGQKYLKFLFIFILMGFEQTVTAQEQDTGVVLNDSIDLLFCFSQKKWIEVWNY